MLERSPRRNASGGRSSDRVVSFGRRTPSNVAKKNVRLRITGPPADAPNALVRTLGLIGSPAAFLGVNCVTPSRALSWKNQNVDPCSTFVPLLLVVVMSVT